MMTETEQKILSALQALNQAVLTMATAKPKPNLVPFFTELDALTRQLPAGADPELLHFLHRKSYEKARCLLEGRRTALTRGSCH